MIELIGLVVAQCVGLFFVYRGMRFWGRSMHESWGTCLILMGVKMAVL